MWRTNTRRRTSHCSQMRTDAAGRVPMPMEVHRHLVERDAAAGNQLARAVLRQLDTTPTPRIPEEEFRDLVDADELFDGDDLGDDDDMCPRQ